MVYEHLTYLDLDPTRIQVATFPSPISRCWTRCNRLIPVVGNPLADLLQHDMKMLVNLGFGSITGGWSQRPANVATPFELFPTDSTGPMC